MPNPLNTVHPNPSVFFGNLNSPVHFKGKEIRTPFDFNPRLALLAFEVVRAWSDVENRRLDFYMSILGRQNEHAKIAFLSLDSESAKNKSIRAVAENSLSPDLLGKFEKLQKFAKSTQRTRNRICHWTWGYSLSISDGFLLGDPRKRALDRTFPHSSIFVYKESDFRDACNKSEKIAYLYGIFSDVVANHPVNHDGKLERILEDAAELR